MKLIKKLMLVLVTFMMVMSTVGTVLAEETTSYTITIENGVDGQTYNVFKVFDVTLADEDGDGVDDDYDGYAYSISTTSPWFAPITGAGERLLPVYEPTEGGAKGLTFTQSSADATKYIVTFDPDVFSAKDFAAMLAGILADTTISPEATLTGYSAQNKTVTVTELGYYFVDSTMGSLCSLDTTDHDVTIYEKNTKPTLTKEVKEDDTTITVGEETSVANTYGHIASASINEEVEFKMVVNTGADTQYYNNTDDEESLGNGVSSNYVITDTLPEGLTYDGSHAEPGMAIWNPGEVVVVKVGSTEWTYDRDGIDCMDPDHYEGDYAVSYVNHVLTITLLGEKLSTLGADTDIEITYKARVNDKAVIGGEGNPNTAYLTYTGDSIDYVTPTVDAVVYVNAMAIYKFSAAGTELAGAQFNMKDGQHRNSVMYFVKKSAGDATTPAVYEYVSLTAGVKDTNVIETPASGAVIIYGLDIGRYTLTEIAAPEGYNMLAGDVAFEVVYGGSGLEEDVVWDKTVTGYEDMTGSATFVAGTDDTYSGVTYPVSPVLGILNLTGAELPSTGGIGTTIFHVVGALMVLGAGIVLISKKRMGNN